MLLLWLLSLLYSYTIPHLYHVGPQWYFSTPLVSLLVEILCVLVSCRKPNGLRSLLPEHLFMVQKVINLASNIIYFVHVFPKACCH